MRSLPERALSKRTSRANISWQLSKKSSERPAKTIFVLSCGVTSLAGELWTVLWLYKHVKLSNGRTKTDI